MKTWIKRLFLTKFQMQFQACLLGEWVGKTLCSSSYFDWALEDGLNLALTYGTITFTLPKLEQWSPSPRIRQKQKAVYILLLFFKKL